MNSSDQAAAYWQPVLLRALVAAAFGVVTIFWQEPGQAVMAVAGGLYLLFSGAAVWLLARKPDAGDFRTLLLLQAGAFAVAGLLALVLQAPATFTILATAALLIGGGAELVLWWQNRGAGGSLLAKDWLITGAVSVGFGAALPFFTHLGAHALLGVLGGQAIIVAVVLGIAAATYRFESRKAAAG
ncbi:integral membrane protein [Arthrobacter crystallopoietes BAB-32]|uniref:Integral membrane protein n=2 Tax=Crystallibacter crystallopoietes TaxID=37928 RepID=N1UTG7_9MICC|nr:integral membrane protein [Arthrobacter crystallopoietes BAB-32]